MGKTFRREKKEEEYKEKSVPKTKIKRRGRRKNPSLLKTIKEYQEIDEKQIEYGLV